MDTVIVIMQEIETIENQPLDSFLNLEGGSSVMHVENNRALHNQQQKPNM